MTAILGHLNLKCLAVSALGTGYLAAFLSSIMNNVPTVLVDALVMHYARLQPVTTQILAENLLRWLLSYGCMYQNNVRYVLATAII